jgi:hypothetical protein
MKRTRRSIFRTTTVLLLLFSSTTQAEIYIIKIGTNYHSLYNLCIGDTLRFVGDSANMNVYGSVQGYVYNNQTSNYDNFNIVSYTGIATSYDHILAAGDTSFFYNLGTFYPLTDGNLFFNCLSTNIEKIASKSTECFYLNPFSQQTILQTSRVLKEAELTVYDEHGRQVKQIKGIFGNTIVVKRDGLKNGIYYFLLTQDSEIVFENKLVIID